MRIVLRGICVLRARGLPHLTITYGCLVGFLIGTKCTPSREDVRGDTRGPRPSSLGVFETSHADELPDRDFWRRQDGFKPDVQ